MNGRIFLGRTDGRVRPTDEPTGRGVDFFLTDDERATGMHVIGAPGTGKSKFLEHLIRQDIDEGRGLCLIDPHGDLYDDVLTYCANFPGLHRAIIPLNLSGRHVVGFNPFAGDAGAVHTRVNNSIAATVRAWGARDPNETPTLERMLRALYTALADNGLTIVEARHLLTFDDDTAELRDYLTSRIGSETLRNEWRELAAMNARDRQAAMLSTKNRLVRFLEATAVLRFMSLTGADTLDLRAVMDRGAVLLVNLRQVDGVLDQMDARLFGSLLVSKFFEVARGRGGRGQPKPRPFYLYCDEFQNFVSPDVAEILPQGRKFGLSLILAHQFLGQLAAEDERLVEAVMAAARTKVVFGGISPADAAAMQPALFAGQIDYHETKRIDRTTGRAATDARGTSHTSARGTSTTDVTGTSHTDAASRGGGSGFGSGLVESSGWTSPAVGATLAGGSTFAGTSHGRNESSFDSSSDSSAHTTSEAHAETTSESEADTTSEAHADTTSESETERPWSLEEQQHRQADALTRQRQRQCFVKPRDGDQVAVLVPLVKPYSLPRALVDAYEAKSAIKAGGRLPADVDAITTARTLQITHEAREFFDRSRAEALKSQEYVEPSRPKRRPKQSRQA